VIVPFQIDFGTPFSYPAKFDRTRPSRASRLRPGLDPCRTTS
jgi:hypothetical protein